MAGSYTYPGVYVKEIPSEVRTIAAVSTSSTAFVDFFARGPMNRAVRITSFGDFARRFGGLHPDSEASYAIQQYFLNGGSTAWVVRVAGGTPLPAGRDLLGGSPADITLRAEAAEEGIWGDNLQVAVVAAPAPDRFNLFVREVQREAGQVRAVLRDEAHLNLSMSTLDARYAPDVLRDASALLRLSDEGLGQLPVASAPTPRGGVPDAAWQDLTGGNNGTPPQPPQVIGDDIAKTGLYALDRIAPEIFNILCLPGAAAMGDAAMAQTYAAATTFVEQRRAFLLIDIPAGVDSEERMRAHMTAQDNLRHKNAAIYFPRLLIPDPLREGRARNVAPSGTLAGLYARTDATRGGPWKSPAGTEAQLRNADLAVRLTDAENGALNPSGINVLRNFPVFGNVAWGARTLFGADQQASEWKYTAVRRTALFIEESLYQGLKWVVFEPNDERLWSQIRLNVTGFMHGLFRQGAFQGTTPREAYLVKCDAETTTQGDIDRGIVNIVVGFKPLKPAEFVVLQIQQLAGQTEV
jgi:phage tail sheath protein FI